MKYLLFLFLLFPIPVHAQTPLTFSGVVQVDSASKTDLYNRARLWFADAFKSSKDVLQITDKEDGQLVGKGNYKYYSEYFVGSAATEGVVNFTVKVFVKDGRYKYEISDFIHEAYRSNENRTSVGPIYTDTYTKLHFLGGKKQDLKVWNELLSLSKKNAEGLIASLKSFMSNPTAQSQDW